MTLPPELPSSHWRVPMLDPWRSYCQLEDELTEAFHRVIRSGKYILGPEVIEFENRLAHWLGVEHCVGMSSGTDALLATVMALGIRPGDEVITSPLTFVATAEVLLRVGATPVFVDVCPTCLCLDPLRVSAAINKKTRAILAVDLFGQLSHLEELENLARDCGAALIEDACQAFGSRRKGRPAGTFGKAGCFSFFPSKPLGGFGDAGIVATQDPEFATRLRAIRSHGSIVKNSYTSLGGNFRLDALHAALLNVLLGHADDWILSRQNEAKYYTQALADVAEVLTPKICNEVDSAWSVYTLRVPHRRDALSVHLSNDGIETAVYYPTTLAEQQLFRDSARVPQPLDVATAVSREVLALPIYPCLGEADQSHVVSSICRHFDVRRPLVESRAPSPKTSDLSW